MVGGLELGEGRSNTGLQKDREEKKNMWSLWLLSHNDDVGWDCGIEVCHYDVERLENLQASIWNTSAVEGSYTQQTIQKSSFSKPWRRFSNILQPRPSGKQLRVLSRASVWVLVGNAAAAVPVEQLGSLLPVLGLTVLGCFHRASLTSHLSRKTSYGLQL